MTDAKGSHAPRGLVFFDRDCRVCASLARRFRRSLKKRGFGLAALQDSRARALLNAPAADLLRELRVASSDGKIYGGADAVVYLARQIWWAWPLAAAAKLPGVPRILGSGYRWFAEHRGCLSGVCSALDTSKREDDERVA